MIQFLLFLHVIGAVGLGYYLIMPLLTIRLKALSGSSLEGYLGGLYGTSRVAQYLLILQLLTGGYLMSKADYSVLWMVLTTVFFVLVAAISGMMNGKMKKAIKALKSGGNADGFMKSIVMFGYLSSISMLLILYVMMYPMFD